jgi:transposase
MDLYYAGIDLHSNNLWLAVVDQEGRQMFSKRLANDPRLVVQVLSEWAEGLVVVAVESTFNWCWLVDALQEAGYPVELVHANAVRPYEGIKHRDDRRDALWLAELARLGVLPRAYICPRELRDVRYLLRKRALLVRHRTAHLLSVGTCWQRELGIKLSRKTLKGLTAEEVVEAWEGRRLVGLAVQTSWEVIQTLDRQIARLEQAALAELKSCETVRLLETTPGIGPILGWTIHLETGTIERFGDVGHYASYCRCVDSRATSNGKKKGAGNRKNGNVYLKCAFQEAAIHALRLEERARRYYDRKLRRRNAPVAHAALASKRCRAAYWIQRRRVAYDPSRQFA